MMTSLIPVIQQLDELLAAPTMEIGSVISMAYDRATVVTNDFKTRAAGGVPRRCFLLASPVLPEGEELEELVLLSVDTVAPLESSRSFAALREDAAIAGTTDLDPRTQASLQNIGFSCKVAGTFFKREDGTVGFGSDMDSLWGNAMFRVYRPRGRALSLIASYGPVTAGSSVSSSSALELGVVRYTETQKMPDPDAKVFVNVEDFLGKKTAVFGATRSGKSNTIKTIAKKVFDYGRVSGQKRVGQLIFDPQGEYANPNSQDGKSALAELGNEDEVHIYRMVNEITHPKEKHLQFNLFEQENLELTWELMLTELHAGISGGSNYIAPLQSVHFMRPTKGDSKAWVHYNRKLLGLYALMSHARFDATVKPFRISVGVENVDAALDRSDELARNPGKPGEVLVDTTRGARLLFTWLAKSQNALTDSWREDFESGDMSTFWGQVEAMDAGRNGVVASFQRIRPLHNEHAEGDVREKIWHDLKQGRLIIVDLSRGSSRTTTALSELIVNYLINQASANFTSKEDPIPFQIIVEEAHNLFRREGSKSDDIDPWVRMSKEAAKYEIGLVYATQEVSSVDPQILSNTANFLVAHLASRTETRELAKYYTFEDWAEHLTRVETRGFVRMKTQSSPYILPVQVEKFVVDGMTVPPAAVEEPEDEVSYDELDFGG